MAERAQSYKDLLIWQRSIVLAEKVYSTAKQLPAEELYALRSQIQRCAISIPSNIAEGQERSSSKEFIHFLCISRGSAAELETQLLLAAKIYSLQTEPLIEESQEIRRMISALIKTLRTK